MSFRRWLLVAAGMMTASLMGVALAGSAATGAEAPARPADGNRSIKVGIVDLRRAFQASKSVQEAKEELVQERNEKLQFLKARQGELKQLMDTLRSQRELLSDVVRRQKEEDFRRKRRRLERLKNDAEQELNRHFMAINQVFLADAQKEILAMGRDSDYTFIMDVNNDFVLYGSESVDLTDQLIKRLNDHHWSQR